MNQGDILAAQLTRELEGGPEKRAGLPIAQIDRAVRGGLKSSSAKEGLDDRGLGCTEGNVLVVGSSQASSDS
jgi:hypothetical protein